MDNSAKFGMLCAQSLERQYKNEARSYRRKIKCTDAHYERMSEILGFKVGKARAVSKKAIALILIAAVLLVAASCAVYVYREQIGELLVEVREKALRITAKDPAAPLKPIEKRYIPGYMPEGYSVDKLTEIPYFVGYIYRNKNDNGAIMFSQSGGGSWSIDAGTEGGGKETFYLDDGTAVLYIYDTSTHSCLWNYDGYYMEITASDEMSLEELVKIINGLEIIE